MYTEYVKGVPHGDRMCANHRGRAGQAGGQLAKALSDPESGFGAEVVLVGDEPHLPYERPGLSKSGLRDGSCEPEIFTVPADVYARPNLTHISNDAVVHVDPDRSIATLASGKEIAFSRAVFATGGRPLRLPVEGAEHCLDLRTLDDSRRLRAALKPGAHLIVIGGGVIGMEVAATARDIGAHVTVIEAGARIMGRILSPAMSRWLEARHHDAGTRVLTGRSAERVVPADGGYAVTLSDGTGLDADLVLSAIGIAPNTSLAPKDAIGASGGLVTDAYGQLPNYPNLFAIGDVAECENAHLGRSTRLETWRNADNHARTLARTLAGDPVPHVEIPWMWSDQLGHNIQVVGLYDPALTEVQRGRPCAKGAAAFWLKDGILTGGVLIDNGRERRFLEKLVAAHARLSPADLADDSIPLKSLLKGTVTA